MTDHGAARIRQLWSAPTPGRGYEHGHALLGGYFGILQVDGDAAYKKLMDSAGTRKPSTLAFCWSHVRRGFYDLAKEKTGPIVTEALTRIEAEIRGLSAADRLSLKPHKRCERDDGDGCASGEFGHGHHPHDVDRRVGLLPSLSLCR